MIDRGLFICRYHSDDGRSEDYAGGREWNLSKEIAHPDYSSSNKNFSNTINETSDEYELALYVRM